MASRIGGAHIVPFSVKEVTSIANLRPRDKSKMGERAKEGAQEAIEVFGEIKSKGLRKRL